MSCLFFASIVAKHCPDAADHQFVFLYNRRNNGDPENREYIHSLLTFQLFSP